MHMGKHKCVNVNNCFGCHMKTQKKNKKKSRKSNLSCTMNTKYYYEILDVPWKYIFTFFFLGDNKWYLGQKDYVGEDNHLDWRDGEA